MRKRRENSASESRSGENSAGGESGGWRNRKPAYVSEESRRKRRINISIESLNGAQLSQRQLKSGGVMHRHRSENIGVANENGGERRSARKWQPWRPGVSSGGVQNQSAWRKRK
jgi:hypothetical protein